MAQTPFKGPEFRALFKEWNERLKDDGFIDAEDFSLPEPALKTWHSFKWESETAQKRESSAKTYYEFASELLNGDFVFKNDVHRRTWELHCAGKSEREIEQALFSQLIGYRGTKKTNIHDVIVFIQKASGLKK